MKSSANAKYIDHYIDNGFIKICQVEDYCNHWYYKNVDRDLMYEDHRSWVYFIVRDREIVKIGETEQPLGIYTPTEDQPKSGTDCRLGRLRKQKSTTKSGKEDTDEFIRDNLREDISNGIEVSIWALKCPTVGVERTIGTSTSIVGGKFHKDLEKQYIDYFERCVGQKPILNKGRA